MKVLLVNTFDSGGAATAIIRIHRALLSNGIDSTLLVLRKKKESIPNCIEFPKKSVSFLKKAKYKAYSLFTDNTKQIKEKYPEVEWFSNPITPYDITQLQCYKEADIVQFNWVSGFIDESTFFQKNNKPLVWRMPDLYACGGGYHYEKGFPFKELKEHLKRNEAVRRKALKGMNITFIPISNWVLQKANESLLLEYFPKQLIHNGLDFKTFKWISKKDARKSFQLDMNKRYLLFGADIIKAKRKGLHLAEQTLKKLNELDIIPVFFGKGTIQLDIPFIHMGYIKDPKRLSALYTAADVFVMTATEEAFGQTTLEALAMGTPVVSFPNGGALDMIQNGFNGFLAESFTVSSLVSAIQKAVVTQFDNTKIRQDVQNRFSIFDKANEYINLYKEILKA